MLEFTLQVLPYRVGSCPSQKTKDYAGKARIGQTLQLLVIIVFYGCKMFCDIGIRQERFARG
jgi:hypothetical protein